MQVPFSWESRASSSRSSSKISRPSSTQPIPSAGTKFYIGIKFLKVANNILTMTKQKTKNIHTHSSVLLACAIFKCSRILFKQVSDKTQHPHRFESKPKDIYIYYRGTPCLPALCFIVLRRCSVFYKLKARPSTSKKTRAHFIEVVQNWTCKLSDVCLYLPRSARKTMWSTASKFAKMGCFIVCLPYQETKT